MAFSVINNLARNLHRLRLDPLVVPLCDYNHFSQKPRYRPPHWFVNKERVANDDQLTVENRQFIKEVLEDRYSAPVSQPPSPLAAVESEGAETQPWDTRTRRCGLILRKIGNYPMWLKNGKKVQTTLLQVVDNHVIKYTPPEEFKPKKTTKVKWREHNTLGCLLVGSQTIDPASVTKEYMGLFKDTGMLPKKRLCRFMVSPHAKLPVGTPLYASHFRVGDVVDIRAKTMDRGFQGVMKRWGFKGMPASHGVTKTHRRGGNIGGGGEKARVWPGKKMPGHMGNRDRTIRGVKILRINNKHNVLWTLGVAIPGGTGALCYMFDTVLPLRKLETAPPFPTYRPSGDEPEEVFHESVHPFHEETIAFQPE